MYSSFIYDKMLRLFHKVQVIDKSRAFIAFIYGTSYKPFLIYATNHYKRSEKWLSFMFIYLWWLRSSGHLYNVFFLYGDGVLLLFTMALMALVTKCIQNNKNS